MTTKADPLQHPLRLMRCKQKIDLALVKSQRTLLGAIKLCISAAGFDSDKTLYMDLGIDPGHWSRIMRGEAHFPIDKLPDLMDACGNESPLLWLVDARGYDTASLRQRESELERELRESREQLERERLKVHTLTEALHGRVA